MTKTFKELIEIDLMVAKLYENDENLEQSKFGYCYKRFADHNFYPEYKKYRESLEDLRIDHANVNTTTKAILSDPQNPRGYSYTKEGLKAIIAAERSLEEEWHKKDIEITPRFCAKENLPELTEDQAELLKGLIIE